MHDTFSLFNYKSASDTKESPMIQGAVVLINIQEMERILHNPEQNFYLFHGPIWASHSKLIPW